MAFRGAEAEACGQEKSAEQHGQGRQLSCRPGNFVLDIHLFRHLFWHLCKPQLREAYPSQAFTCW